MITLLHAGFDTLDIAFAGAFPEVTLEKLDKARDQAEKRQEPELTQVGDRKVQAHIHGHGMRGGFRYILDTGSLGAKWMIKHNLDRSQWNFFASPRATMLLAYGYRETFNRLLSEIEQMGARITDHSVNRADFAMDFQMAGFELHPEQVVAHSHTKVAPYWSACKETTDNDHPSAILRGRRVESITIGKQPGRQIIIYDKRREAIERNKLYWFKTWARDRHDKNLEVWRIEVRAGKSELKKKYRLSTFQDFESSIGDAITNALQDIRYLEDAQFDSNVSRQTLHPLWQAAQATAAKSLTDLRSGLTPGQIQEIERAMAQDKYRALCAGNAIGFGVASGMTDEEIKNNLPKLMQQEITEHFRAKGRELDKSIKRSRDRLAFLD